MKWPQVGDFGWPPGQQQSNIDVMALDDALNRLAGFDANLCRLVELRFFGGLSIEDTAAVMSVSPATVKREWAAARAAER